MINKRLANLALKTPIRGLKSVIQKLCDYDLLAVAQLEYRLPAYKMLLAEAKRRDILKPEKKTQEKVHPDQLSLFG